MKFHRKALISYIPCPSKSTCPLGANQAFEGLIRLSICCQLCSFSANYGHLGQVIYVTKLICIHSGCSHSETGTTEPVATRLLRAHIKHNKQKKKNKGRKKKQAERVREVNRDMTNVTDVETIKKLNFLKKSPDFLFSITVTKL